MGTEALLWSSECGQRPVEKAFARAQLNKGWVCPHERWNCGSQARQSHDGGCPQRAWQLESLLLFAI
eukprot:2783395-Amphidinium_carterae.1